MDKREYGILIVDDELIVRESLSKWFRQDGYRVDVAEDGARALEKFRGQTWHIMLVDIKMPGMDGIELLQRAKEINPAIIVIVITAFASVDTAVQALKSGAYDYITKPIDPDHLDHQIEKALQQFELVTENLRLKETVSEMRGREEIIGESPEMKKVLELIRSVAPTDTAVTIVGESGTGKELVARAIHHQSPRRYFPLVTVHCGAMTEPLLLGDLFGHERGGSIGNFHRRTGKIELANGGTLLLDEVGSLGPTAQRDLLGAIESKQFTRIEGSEPVQSDFRVVCTTQTDLQKCVREGSFREDLFLRLSVCAIILPPLRARRGDVAKLAHFLLEKYSRQMSKRVRGFSADAMHALKSYDWPGNVRELENAIERAMVVTTAPTIEKEHLPLHTTAGQKPNGKRLEDLERQHIELILKETGWNVSKSAAILDIDRVTLYHKIERYGLKRD